MRKILFMLLAMCTLASCGKNDGGDDGDGGGEDVVKAIEVEAGQTSQVVYADNTSGTGGVTFKTTGAWSSSITQSPQTRTVAPDSFTDSLQTRATAPDWISIDPASGTGAGTYTITITLDNNYTGQSRSATITITCGSDTISITITQGGTTVAGVVPEENKPLEPIFQTDSITISEGGKLMLNTQNIAAVWSSNNSAVATVNEQTGELTGISIGEAIITATPESGKTAKSVVVTVVMDVLKEITDQAFNDYAQIALSNSLYFGDFLHREWDINRDGKLSIEEAALVTHINLASRNVGSLAGIEYFTGLKSLNCNYTNRLTAIDLTKNTKLTEFSCISNNLSTLDLTKNIALRSLGCNDNKLTTLDVTKNTELVTLYCINNKLTTLDVSKNSKLAKMRCDNNQLTELNIANNTELTWLFCPFNKLNALDVTNNTKLDWLECDNNMLTSLNVAKNIDLTTLSCRNNLLTTLNIKNNTKLHSLNCFGNGLSELDVSNMAFHEGTNEYYLQCGYQDQPLYLTLHANQKPWWEVALKESNENNNVVLIK